MQFSPLPCYLVPILEHAQSVFLPQCERPSFTLMQNNRQNDYSLYSRTPLIRIANYPDLPGPSSKYIENCTKQLALKLPVTISSTVLGYGF